MKFKIRKVAAAAMAAALCVPCVASASSTGGAPAPVASSGSFETSFDVYSPTLTVSVPLTLDIQVNPFSNSSATDVSKFEVASNSIDIMNASVDVEADTSIPINATIIATITSKADDVKTEYNTFSSAATSKVKRVYLTLAEAKTAAAVDVKTGETAGFIAADNKRLDLSKFAVETAADYSAATNEVVVTQYGSLLSVDIAGPSTSDNTIGATFSTDATKVSPAVGSFAITGVANAAADWKSTDLAVAVTYDIRASKALNFVTPKVAPIAHTSGTSATDLDITVTGVGEAKVAAMALHNEADGAYGDFIFDAKEYTVDYATAGSAKVTISKDNGALAFLAGDDYKGKAQDLIIALSDGRMVVTKLTVN